MPPFAESPNRAPVDQEAVLELGSIALPAYAATCLVNLNGTSFVLSGDTKGFITAWNAEAVESESPPEFYFEAHTGAVRCLTVLRTGWLAELVEQQECTSGAARKHGEWSSRPPSSKGMDVPASKVVPADVPLYRPVRNTRSKWWSCLGCCGADDWDVPTEDAMYWLILTTGEDMLLRLWRWRLAVHRKRGKDTSPFEVDLINEWSHDISSPGVLCKELHDGQLALVLADVADVRLVDPWTGAVRWVLYGHTGPVSALAETWDGRLISGGTDGAVRLWDRRRLERDVMVDQRAAVNDPRLAWNLAWSNGLPESGVPSLVFHASAKEATSECSAARLRVRVERVEGLAQVSSWKSRSDRAYVTCQALQGEPGGHVAQTTSRPVRLAAAVWDEWCKLPLILSTGVGANGLSDACVIEFEIFRESPSRWRWSKPCRQAVGRVRWTFEEVLDCIRGKDVLDLVGAGRARPDPRQIFSPDGEGPWLDLEGATLIVEFEQSHNTSLLCLVSRVEGLPLLEGQHLSIQARVQYHSAAVGPSQLVKHSNRTSSVPVARGGTTPTAFFEHTLDLQVPVFQTERGVTIPTDLFLHFQVCSGSHREEETEETIIGTLTLPVEEALQRNEASIRAYDLALEPCVHPTRTLSKRLADAAKQWPDVTTDPPRLYLSFELIVPCPLMLRSMVDHIDKMWTLPDMMTPRVQMRFVEGDPTLPQSTAFRTSICLQTANPVWNEKCDITLPQWLVDPDLARQRTAESKAILAGWELLSSQPRVVLCIDVYSAGLVEEEDVFLARACLPFPEVMEMAKDGNGAPRPASLNTQAAAKLWVGVRAGPSQEQLTVIIERAEKLGSRSGALSSWLDPYCHVCITELGALEEPTNQGQAGHWMSATPPTQIQSSGKAEWNHSEVLEMPGRTVETQPGVAPNWHLLLEVADILPQSQQPTPVACASIPLSDILDELAELEGVATRPRSTGTATSQQARTRPAQPSRNATAVRQLALTDAMLTTTHKQAVQVPAAERDANHLKHQSSRRVPFMSAARRRRASTSMRQTSVSMASSDGASEASALRAAASDADKVKEPAMSVVAEEKSMPTLSIRFQVLSRWSRPGRRKNTQKARAFAAPSEVSPVTCLLALGSTALAGYADGAVCMWDLSGRVTGALHHIAAHEVPVTSLVLLQQQDCFVTTCGMRSTMEAGSSSCVRLWSCTTMELRQTLSVPELSLYCMETLSKPDQDSSRPDNENAPCLAFCAAGRTARVLQFVKLGRG